MPEVCIGDPVERVLGPPDSTRVDIAKAVLHGISTGNWAEETLKLVPECAVNSGEERGTEGVRRLPPFGVRGKRSPDEGIETGYMAARAERSTTAFQTSAPVAVLIAGEMTHGASSDAGADDTWRCVQRRPPRPHPRAWGASGSRMTGPREVLSKAGGLSCPAGVMAAGSWRPGRRPTIRGTPAGRPGDRRHQESADLVDQELAPSSRPLALRGEVDPRRRPLQSGCSEPSA